MASQFFENQIEARAQSRQLSALFALTVLALVVLVNLALGLAFKLLPFVSHYPAGFFQINTAVVLLFVLGGWWVETSNLADGPGSAVKLAKRMGARELLSTHADERQLGNVVAELAIASSLPPPTTMLLAYDKRINAFSTGWSAENAVVAVTQGALDRLTREELQGLIAHELGHIKEGDIRVNMRLAGMVWGLDLLYRMGSSMSEPGSAGSQSLLMLPGLLLKGLGWAGAIAGRALQAAVSRQREFLADARAVQFTRDAHGLGGVLRKAERDAQQAPEDDSASDWADLPGLGGDITAQASHMMLIGADSRWFASHPPLAERIRLIYGRSMPPLEAETEPARLFTGS